mmetsp:Transcript_55668/g.132729  ORF Transcript_55668/g.132729 Transcript_55668/m.132729 type:complete len:337 (-) Transcript_55668:13-1023(-)
MASCSAEGDAALELDKLLSRMEGYARELRSAKESSVRSRTAQWELERCLDDVRDLLLQWLDPAQRNVVVDSFSHTAGVTRAARLEVFLKADIPNVFAQLDGIEGEQPESELPGRRPSGLDGYVKKVEALKVAFSAVKGILDSKSQRLIDKAVTSLQTIESAAPSAGPSSNDVTPPPVVPSDAAATRSVTTTAVASSTSESAPPGSEETSKLEDRRTTAEPMADSSQLEAAQQDQDRNQELDRQHVLAAAPTSPAAAAPAMLQAVVPESPEKAPRAQASLPSTPLKVASPVGGMQRLNSSGGLRAPRVLQPYAPAIKGSHGFRGRNLAGRSTVQMIK